MIKTHAFLYFGSRLSAAAANLAAVAIFSRLAGSEVYGGSILVFSWGFVVFGFCGQWLGAAFFAIYRPEEAGRQVATLTRLAIAATGTAGLATAAVVSVGLASWGFGAAVFSTVLGLLLFVTVTEVERTRLDAGWVAIMYIARAALVITLGSLVLLLGGGSLALASALAGANVIAAAPGLFRIGRSLAARPERATSNEFVNYGWPLMIAFGAMALGQNIDRLILVHVAGIGELGAYGATSDFLKQGFGVVCEAITLASVSVAKDAATRGDDAKTRLVLEDAFRAVTATVVFGVVFMTTFSSEIVDVIFGPDYRVAARAVMPWLIGANAALALRAFYFGQAIYFGQSSRNEAVASLSMIVVTAVLGFTLIPRFGVFGAAMAATGGQLAACAIFVASRPRMPIPVASAVGIWGVGAATLALATLVDHSSSGSSTAKGVVKLLLLVGAGLGVVWRHDILGLREVAKGLARRWLNQGTKLAGPGDQTTTPRILQIIHGDEAGGVKTLADTLGETLRADGHVVDTVCLFPPHAPGFGGRLAGVARVGRLILTGRYEAVIAYQSTGSVVAGVAGWLARCPRRIVHQTALPSELKPALRWLDLIVGSCGLYTVNVLNSKATWAAFARYPARYRSRMRLIEHGVAAPVPKRDRAATLARFAVPDDRRILLNVGRLAAQKNQEVLIRALAEISSARLVVAGDGPLRGALEAAAAEWGVADRVHLLGDVGAQDVADLLAASDVFVFPSIWESFGLAAVEAALLGRPIVASDLDVLREVLAGRDVAVSFVPPNDATAWTAAIRAALAPAVRRPAARSGPAISERYTVRRMADAYGGLLAGATGPPAAQPSKAGFELLR